MTRLRFNFSMFFSFLSSLCEIGCKQITRASFPTRMFLHCNHISYLSSLKIEDWLLIEKRANFLIRYWNFLRLPLCCLWKHPTSTSDKMFSLTDNFSFWWDAHDTTSRLHSARYTLQVRLLNGWKMLSLSSRVVSSLLHPLIFFFRLLCCFFPSPKWRAVSSGKKEQANKRRRRRRKVNEQFSVVFTHCVLLDFEGGGSSSSNLIMFYYRNYDAPCEEWRDDPSSGKKKMTKEKSTFPLFTSVVISQDYVLYCSCYLYVHVIFAQLETKRTVKIASLCVSVAFATSSGLAHSSVSWCWGRRI